MKTKICILLLLTTISCKSQEISKTDYKLVNIVVDSLVKLSHKDTIGLRVETLNSSLSEERATHPGSMRYVNGKFINDCPGNEIRDSLYTEFNYEKFVSRPQFWNLKHIKNKYIISDFNLRKEHYKNMLNDFITSNPKLNKKDMEEYLWIFERNISIQSIATPVYSDDKKIGLVIVKLYSNGLQSWQLRKNEKDEWYLFCIKQIEFE